MIRSRLARALAFGLSLFATAISSVASGATLVLCAEPDGCVELEVIAPGQALSSGCGGHEHEDPDPEPLDSPDVDSCPCTDTVIEASTDNLRPDKSKIGWAPSHESTPTQVPSPRIASDRGGFESLGCKAARPSSRSLLSQRSVVLRI